MAEMHGEDTGPGIAPASPPPAADSPGKRLQTLQNPLIFLLAAVCGLCLAVPKAIARGIWANAWIIAIFLVLSSLAGYLINSYLEKYDSAYTASGTIRILQLQSLNPVHPAADDSTSLEIEKVTETARFRSESLVDDILKDPDNPIRATAWWKVTCASDPDKAHALLFQNLNVDTMPGSVLMRISFTSPDKADTAVVLTAVVNRAIQDDRDFIRNKYDMDRKRFADLRDRYEIELRNAMSDVKAKIAELTQIGGNPGGPGLASQSGGFAGPKETEVSARVNELVGLQTAKADIDNAVAEMTKMKEQGQVPPQVQHMIDEDRNVIRVEDALDSIVMRLTDAQGQGDPKSTALDELTKEQELWQKRLDDLKARKLTDYLAAYSSQMDRSKKTVDDKLRHCSSEIARLEAELADIANKTISLKSREEDMGVDRERVIEYDRGLTDLDQLIRQNEIGAMQWFVRPRAPSTRDFPNLGSIMTMAVLFGLALSLGIAFLREIAK